MRWVFLVAILLMLTACGSQPQSSISARLSGTEGVIITPLGERGENSGMTAYEGESFPFTFKYNNSGTHDITAEAPGYFHLTYDHLYLHHDDTVTRSGDNTFTLFGKLPHRGGEEQFYTAYFTAQDIDRFSEEVQTSILLSACYPYVSKVTQEVCIEQSRIVDSGAIACKNQALRPLSPGAPVGVREVQVRSIRVGSNVPEATRIIPSFRITLENYQSGIPSTTECETDDRDVIDGDRLNTATVYADILNEPLECEPEVVRFERGQAVTNCRLPDTSQIEFVADTGNFITLLTVHAEYNYRITSTGEVTLKR